ncbi:N-formylglutamate amidohydrolase [Sphingorhabdus sp.]|uniref:N-formylglutamate amidohydrolase n=1 Tax=Sphingorhabdus sp. TaxID=1902408 RepID=UPI0039199ED4
MASGTDGFASWGTESFSVPVLLSVPHAGREYPEDIYDALRLPPAVLVRLEDRYADLLTRLGVQLGHPVIMAHRARAWIDLNRDEQDIDTEMVQGALRAHYPAPGIKQRGGLGLIPRRLSGEGDLWNRQFTLDEVQHRITSFHRPYHQAVADILERMRRHFGVAILLDLHSMPPIRTAVAAPAPQFVVGDRFGKSAASQYAELLIARLRTQGFSAALNHPYAGDYILRRHARPRANIHALQLEVDRSLYLDQDLRQPGAGLDRLRTLIPALVNALADEALGSSSLVAAE